MVMYVFKEYITSKFFKLDHRLAEYSDRISLSAIFKLALDVRNSACSSF